MPSLPPDLDEQIRRALAEDLGPQGDVTSLAVVPAETTCRGRVVAREEGVIAGLSIFGRVFSLAGEGIHVSAFVTDGDRVEPGQEVARVEGSAGTVLVAERVALNFLCHLSGVATLTRRYVDAADGTGSTILCTRKTLPGLRSLQRHAVEVGGGRLHRAGLSDAVLIKDNHVRIAGGVAEAVRRAKDASPRLPVEVEVETLDELREALAAGADSILLDNADLGTVREARTILEGRVPLEVSGGVALERVRALAEVGGLLISVGRLTHSAPALDLSLELDHP